MELFVIRIFILNVSKAGFLGDFSKAQRITNFEHCTSNLKRTHFKRGQNTVQYVCCNDVV